MPGKKRFFHGSLNVPQGTPDHIIGLKLDEQLVKLGMEVEIYVGDGQLIQNPHPPASDE